VVVAAFQAPTQVAFFFHSTQTLNPCMWATDLDLSQAAYPAPDCPGCMVRAAHKRAAPASTDYFHLNVVIYIEHVVHALACTSSWRLSRA